MKNKVLQENLQQSLGYVQKAIPSRPALPILSSVLITAQESVFSIVATDLYFGIKASLPAAIEDAGKVVVPGKELKEIIQSLPPGELDLSSKKNLLQISSQRTKSSIQCQVGEEYPQFPEAEGGKFSLPTQVLNVLSEKVLKSVSTDQTRPILTGVMMDFSNKGLRVVGTDGFRLAIADFSEIQVSNPNTLIIPGKVIDEVRRIAIQKNKESVDFYFSEENKQVFFSFEDVEIFSRLIDGEFPPYQKIIPQDFENKIEVQAADLHEQIKRALIFAKDSSGIIQIHYDDPSGLIIKAESPSIGSFEGLIDSAKVEGQQGVIAFNARYLIDFLQPLSEEVISISLSGALKPAKFKVSSAPNFQYIVMPFRVNS